MSIKTFLSRLKASFTKDELKQSIRILTQALEKAISTFSNSEEVTQTLKSKAGKQFQTDFSKMVRVPPRLTPMAYIRQVLTNMAMTVELVSGLVDKNYGNDIVVEGITYRRAELLRTIGYMDFVVTYAVQLLHYILVAEASVTSKEHAEGKERPQPELRYLKENQKAFFTLLNTFSKPSRDIAKLLENIPDITIGEDDDKVIVPQVGALKLDPLKNNFIPGISTLSLNIGIWWAHIQVARYDRLKEEVRSIQLRIEQLRLQQDGRNDAQLEHTIATYESYLNQKSEKLAKLEEKYLS
jgi:hypothetical protein